MVIQTYKLDKATSTPIYNHNNHDHFPFCDKDARDIEAIYDMTTPSATADNPFVDPATSFEDAGRGNSFAVDATLALGRNVSLTLGTDSLIVLGECLCLLPTG